MLITNKQPINEKVQKISPFQCNHSYQINQLNQNRCKELRLLEF